MTEEVKANSRLSNNALLGALVVLILLIIGLIVSIVVTKLNGDNLFKSNYEIAQEACEVLSQGSTPDALETYAEPVAKFESVSSDPAVDRQQEFRNCYMGVRYYYSLNNNQEKMDYYASLLTDMITEEEAEEMRQDVEKFKEQYGNNEEN